MTFSLLVKEAETREEDEAKQNARVSQERQRTLDRLRSLKQVKILTTLSSTAAVYLNNKISE